MMQASRLHHCSKSQSLGRQLADDLSHKPGGRLTLLSAWPTVTFTAAEHYHPLISTKLYCLVTEAHVYVNNLHKDVM